MKRIHERRTVGIETEPKRRRIDTIIEQYDSFGDFTETLSERPPVWEDVYHYSKKRTGDNAKWAGMDSYGDAVHSLLYGYDEDVKTLVGGVTKLQNVGKATKKRNRNGVCGFAPNVPRYVAGLPKDMRRREKVIADSRVLTVVYSPSCSSSVSKESLMEYSIKFLSKLMDLERSGYRIKLEYTEVFTGEHPFRQYILRVPLKSENQPINIKRLAFPITHISMLRYLAIDWAETLPESKEIPYHGSPLKYCGEYARKNVDEILGDNAIYVEYGDDLDKIFN